MPNLKLKSVLGAALWQSIRNNREQYAEKQHGSGKNVGREMKLYMMVHWTITNQDLLTGVMGRAINLICS